MNKKKVFYSLLLSVFISGSFLVKDTLIQAKETPKINIEVVNEDDVIKKQEKKEELLLVNDIYKCNKWASQFVVEADKYNFIPDNINNLKDPLKREIIAKSLMEFYLLYSNDLPDNILNFKDVDDTNIINAISLGLINPTHKNLFSPKKEVSREEAFYLVDNIMDKLGFDIPVIDEEIIFNDKEKINDDYYNAIQKLYKLNLISVDENNNINPDKTISIQEFLTLLVKVKNTDIEVDITNLLKQNQ